jgi:DNA topoisomerase-3
MRLYLCEKPSQARDIARVLGASHRGEGCLRGTGICVTWCFGHLLEMAPPDGYGEQYRRWRLETLPIIPADWRLQPRQAGRKQLNAIQGLLGEAREVVIATDADREGETIAREVLDLYRWQGPVARLWLSALDETSIRKALAALRPGEQTCPLYLAGLGRARADWLVGMNLTRAYTLLGRSEDQAGVRSVGRVQTPTLRIVVDRDRAIEAFVPVPYWDLIATFQPENDDRPFRARWQPADSHRDSEGRCTNEPAARQVAQQVAGSRGRVTDAQIERVTEPPPLPFDLGTLQQEASRRWGMGAQEVLDAAQALYETHKATTYPRTDCPYLPESMRGEAPRVLAALRQSDPMIADQVEAADSSLCSRVWNDAKITAHHAIIPTAVPCDLSKMGEREQRIYDLVRRRYLAQFCPPHRYDRTTVILNAGGETFQATGRRIVTSGWRALFGGEDAGEQAANEQQELPPLSAGDTCHVSDARVEQRATRPQPRYTEGTLIAAMKHAARLVSDPKLKKKLRESAGLGTEATRAGILQTLIKRGFLRRHKRHLISTDTGRLLIDTLPEEVKDPGTTALWEQALDDIAQSRGDLDVFVTAQARWVRDLVQQVQSSDDPSKDGIQDAAPAHPCPDCGKPMRRRKGRRGFFWGCSGYPECTTTLPDAGGKPGQRIADRPVGSCACGGDVRESLKAWQCQGCSAIVWKETAGKQISLKQTLDLFAGKTVRLKGLKSKKGKGFNADARIEGGRVRLLFKGSDGGNKEAQTSRTTARSAAKGGGGAAAGEPCPDCGKGSLVQRTLRQGKNAGRQFFGCSRFPDCRFFTWKGSE